MIGLEAGGRLQVGALLVLEQPRMVGSSHTDIPAMEEFSESPVLFPIRDFRVVHSYWSGSILICHKDTAQCTQSPF